MNSILITARALFSACQEVTMQDLVDAGVLSAADAAAWERHGEVCQGIVDFARCRAERDAAIEREIERNADMLARVAAIRAAERARVKLAVSEWGAWIMGLPEDDLYTVGAALAIGALD